MHNGEIEMSDTIPNFFKRKGLVDVSEFELQSGHYVHFQTIGKGMDPVIQHIVHLRHKQYHYNS